MLLEQSFDRSFDQSFDFSDSSDQSAAQSFNQNEPYNVDTIIEDYKQVKLQKLQHDQSSRLAQLIIQFNLEPIQYAHPSWLPAWADNSNAQISSHLSKHLLEIQGISGQYDWHMKLPESKLFLISSHTLSVIALELGIIAHRDTLKKIVRNEHMMLLRRSVGESLESIWLEHAQSIKKSDTALEISWNSFDASTTTYNLQCAGYALLLSIVHEPKQLKKTISARAALCAPKHLSKTELPFLTEQQRSDLMAVLVKHIIPQRAPEWTWLF